MNSADATGFASLFRSGILREIALAKPIGIDTSLLWHLGDSPANKGAALKVACSLREQGKRGSSAMHQLQIDVARVPAHGVSRPRWMRLRQFER